MPSPDFSGAGRVIRSSVRPDPSARPAFARRAYESLQGSPAVSPLATPRRCHDAARFLLSASSGFADVSPVFTLRLPAKATIWLIEPASARPTFRALHAYSAIDLAVGYPTDREDPQPARSRVLTVQAPSMPLPRSCVDDPWIPDAQAHLVRGHRTGF